MLILAISATFLITFEKEIIFGDPYSSVFADITMFIYSFCFKTTTLKPKL